MEKTKQNHLSEETSAYLIQHANNPVNWYPWGSKALEKAKKENKPILLSIGYAACHWCHVMAHESFEDQETADLMNNLFVNIKVDREERPDLDKIYQTAHALLTQRGGGWPLTIFLTPDDLTPFFCGTYFPYEPRHNLPAFKYVLRTISELYRHHYDDIKNQNAQLKEVLSHKLTQDFSQITLSVHPIKLAKQILKLSYDTTYGGFGSAPKFPQPILLELLLQLTAIPTLEKPEFIPKEDNILKLTLKYMAEGGIYDQLAGGFFRYSIDAEWLIPHFEKMLYDNAQLIYIYALAARQFVDPFFGKIASDTILFLLKYMKAPYGGFYSSLDADFEGQEGRYYVWNKFEIKKILTPEEYAILSPYYGLDKIANFDKLWHLHIAKPLAEVATANNISLDQATLMLHSAKTKLLHVRENREAPACDKKILTAWNALLIHALFIAGDYLQEPRFLAEAETTLHFIYRHCWLNKRLFASCTEKMARFPGYLDDYAFLLQAVLTKLQLKWENHYFQFALDLADALLLHFEDIEQGGFFFTAHDHEALLHRPKPMTDEATPSGNGMAARALISLGYLIGESRYIKKKKKTLKSVWSVLSKYPVEYSTLLYGIF